MAVWVNSITLELLIWKEICANSSSNVPSNNRMTLVMIGGLSGIEPLTSSLRNGFATYFQ